MSDEKNPSNTTKENAYTYMTQRRSSLSRVNRVIKKAHTRSLKLYTQKSLELAGTIEPNFCLIVELKNTKRVFNIYHMSIAYNTRREGEREREMQKEITRVLGVSSKGFIASSLRGDRSEVTEREAKRGAVASVREVLRGPLCLHSSQCATLSA